MPAWNRCSTVPSARTCTGSEPGAFGRTRAALTDHVGWRACAYLLLKLLLSVVGAICMGYLLLWGLPYLTFPIWWEILHAHSVVVYVPGWLTSWKAAPLLVARSVHSLAVSFALVPAGAAVLLHCPWWLRRCNAADGKLVARLLGPPVEHRVRELEQTRAHAVDDAAAGFAGSSGPARWGASPDGRRRHEAGPGQGSEG